MANRAAAAARLSVVRLEAPGVQGYPSPLSPLRSFFVWCGAVCGGNTIAMSVMGIYALGVAEDSKPCVRVERQQTRHKTPSGFL